TIRSGRQLRSWSSPCLPSPTGRTSKPRPTSSSTTASRRSSSSSITSTRGRAVPPGSADRGGRSKTFDEADRPVGGRGGRIGRRAVGPLRTVERQPNNEGAALVDPTAGRDRAAVLGDD